MLWQIRSFTPGNWFTHFQIALEQLRRIHHRQDRIELKIIADLRPRKSAHDGSGQSEAGGLDQNVIDLMFPGLKLLHGWEEIILDGAANASVRQIVDLDATRLAGSPQKRAVHGDLAEFINEHRQPLVRALLQQTANEGGLPRTEESGNDGNWNFHEWIEIGS